jgi:hypothetical protein
MKNKEEFLKKLSLAIDEIKDEDAEISYFNMEFTNYNPDKKHKLYYFQAEIDYCVENGHIIVNDRSEPFRCTMEGGDDCTERGYCNGDC